MPTFLRILTVSLTLGAGLAVASSLNARDAQHTDGSSMSLDMMGKDVMSAMMNMMSRMGGTTMGCNRMMNGNAAPKPNEQWRDKTSAEL